MGDFWTQTINVLQNPADPIVVKPTLAQKYLEKPPFRFLHDVITAVQNKTGFAPGLYQGIELDGKAIQDKQAKVNYLNKMIEVVSAVLGEAAPARAVKMVAGLEPENTNAFLQMLGRACRMGQAADVVQRVLASYPDGGSGAPAAPDPAPAPAAPARPSSRPSSQQRPMDADPPTAPSPPPPAADPDPAKAKKPSKPKPKPAPPPPDPAPAPAAPTPPPADEPPPSLSRNTSVGRSKPPPPPSQDEELPPPVAAAPAGGPMRPMSARKAPPKLASNTTTALPSAGVVRAGGAGKRPSSIGDGPVGAGQPAAARPVAVFEEGAKGDSDDDVEVVHEAAPMALGPGSAAGASGEQGLLVKNILEAEKNLKKSGADAAQTAEEEAGGTGIILKRLGKAGAGGAGASVRPGDIPSIRDMVQRLCQSSHPLAKSMDYLQEDLENMAKEYRFWSMERRLFADKLSDEQRLAGDAQAGEVQLADVDGQIKQVRDRILGLKALVLRNDETVNKLLTMAVTGDGR